MYTFKSRIRYSEVDSKGKLPLEGVLNYFQDGSTFHSQDVGMGIDYLNEKKQLWVLSSWQIVVDHFPKMCENVTIGTFPYDFRGCFGYRNFCMMDESGSYIAKANTLWTLLDMESMRPAKPSEEMKAAYTIEEKLDMEYADRKILLPEGNEGKEAIEVKAQHLDTNQHVNNTQYVRMAMEFLPEGFQIRQMRAEYKKQAHLQDILYPYVANEEGVWTISLQDASGEVYVNVEFKE